MLSPFSRAQLFEILWTLGLQVPLFMQFSRQQYWSGLPCPPQGIFPTWESISHLTVSPALQVDSLSTEPPGEPVKYV